MRGEIGTEGTSLRVGQATDEEGGEPHCDDEQGDPTQAFGVERVPIAMHRADYEADRYQKSDHPIEVAPDDLQGPARPAEMPVRYAARNAQQTESPQREQAECHEQGTMTDGLGKGCRLQRSMQRPPQDGRQDRTKK